MAGLGLGDLVGVMHRNGVLPAAVDVEQRPQVFGGHGRALYMPAGKTLAPWAFPLHLPLDPFGTELPQGKVGGMLLLAHIYPGAGQQVLHHYIGEDPVFLKLGGVKIYPVRRPVGVALLLYAPDGLDLLLYMIGGLAPDMRLLDVQVPEVALKGFGIFPGDLPGGLAGAAGALLHLVLAGIGVGFQMPHVGDVHDMIDLQSVVLQHPSQNVLEDVGAQVADMGVIVDRRTAGVHARLAGL